MLRYSADRRTLGFVATYFALLVVLWVVDLPWWAEAPMYVALCSFSWFCAVITHNTIHCPVFKNKRSNKVFQCVLTLTYGHPVSAFVPGHNLSHHKFTQTPRDVMRTTKVRYRWNLINGLLFFPTVAVGIVKGENAFIKAMKQHNKKWFRQLCIEWAVLIVATAGALIIDWRKGLLLFWLPHMWAAFGIVTINFLQHDGCDQEHPYNHSRNFTGKFFGWFTFENGFHGIHHDVPGLHWSLCRAAHNEKISPHIHPALEQKSMAVYLWKTFVWPAKRLQYDGQPVQLPPPDKDENWVPAPGRLPADVSLGAEA